MAEPDFIPVNATPDFIPMSAAPNAGLAPAAGPSRQMDSGEGPIARGMTSFETQLSKLPGNIVSTIGAKHWPIIDAHNFHELGEDIKSLNPIVHTDTGETGGIDIGATAANLLPAAIDMEGGGIAKSPIGRTARAASSAVRAIPDAVGPKVTALGKVAAKDAASHIPVAGRIVQRPSIFDYVNAARTRAVQPVYPGAPLPDNPGIFPGAHLPENPGIFPGAPLPENPGIFPGAQFPEKPPIALLQARSLAHGATAPSPEAASALERIVSPEAPPSLDRIRDMQPAPSALDRLREQPVPPESNYTPERPSLERIAGERPLGAGSMVDSILSPIERAPESATPAAPEEIDPLLARINRIAAKIKDQEATAPRETPAAPRGRALKVNGKTVPADQDLTSALRRSVKKVESKKQTVQ